jgi:hypothetical protein
MLDIPFLFWVDLFEEAGREHEKADQEAGFFM